MKTNGISRHLGSFIVIAVMLITAPATISFAGRVFGWDGAWSILRSVLLIFTTEIALIAWHEISKRLARGERQHSIATAMTVVTIIGVIGMAGTELLLEFGEANLTTALSATSLGMAGLILLVLLFGLNLAAGVAFQHADPDLMERRSQERVAAKQSSARLMVQDAVADAIHSQVTDRKQELIAPQVDAIMKALMTEQKLMAARAINELRAIGGAIVDGESRPAVPSPTTAMGKDVEPGPDSAGEGGARPLA
jgi:hypothetical protein